MTALEARRGQFIRVVAERDAAIAEVQRIHVERDEAIHLAESREATRIRAMFEATRQASWFDNIELEYRCQIRE